MCENRDSTNCLSLARRISRAELSEKEHLREFLKFVEGESRKSQNESDYVAKLKR